MSTVNQLPRVMKDLFKRQTLWTLAFIGLMLVINIFKIAQSMMQGTKVDNYFNTVLVAGNFYMFVLGIFSIYFLKYFVENGVTRRHYFIGNLIVTVGLSVIIPVLVFIIYKLQRIIAGSYITFNDPQLNSIVTDFDNTTSFFDDIIISFTITPLVDPHNYTLLAIGIFILNLFVYYLAGWLIGVAFQFFKGTTLKYPVLGGLVFIALATVSLTLYDTLMRILLKLPVLQRFTSFAEIPQSIALLSILILNIIIILAIRQMTKRIQLTI